MSIIAIVGAPGVGKSFLARQFASLKCLPVFLEGEDGVLPEKVLRQIFKSSDPLPRYKFFVSRYVKNFLGAQKISKIGLDCFLDGEIISVYSTIAYEDKKYLKNLEKFAKQYEKYRADKIILIVADKKCLRKCLNKRNRLEEKNKKMLDRSIAIQNNFLELAKQQKNIIIIDRSKFDFSKEKDLLKLAKLAKL